MLRLLTAAMYDDLFRAVDPAREDLCRWFEWPDRVTSPETAAAYISEVQGGSRVKVFWLIYEDDEPIGGVQLRLRDGGFSASLPYWLVPSARGKGIATRAVAEAIGRVSALGFRKIKFVIGVDNHRSAKLARRLGMEQVGEPHESELRGRPYMVMDYEWSI